MAGIETYLEQIISAIYGKDVRQAIHDGIQACYQDGKVGAVDLVARQRIDNLAHLEEGSTTGDAELADIRVADNGVEYGDAGSSVRAQIEDAKKVTHGNASLLGTYDNTVLSRRWRWQIFGRFRKATVATARETYFPDDANQARAVMPIPSAQIADKVYIYSMNALPWGVYRRRTSDNSYDGYISTLTANKAFFEFTPEEGYSYFAIFSSADASTSITQSQLDEMNRSISVYTGRHISDNEIVPITAHTNLIHPWDIYIGGYFYGQQDPAPSSEMAYTSYIPVEQLRDYYFPFVTIGYSWYDVFQKVIGGEYQTHEVSGESDRFVKLTAPVGAKYIRLSTRTGDIPFMILSEIPNSKATTAIASTIPALKSRVIRESLNVLYNVPFNQNHTPSRVVLTSSDIQWVFNGDYVTGNMSSAILTRDAITMDASKIAVIFSIPSGSTPEFVFGYNGAYVNLSDESAGFAVLIKANGTQAEIRRGSGSSGAYNTLLRTVDISALNIHGGGQFILMIEKDTINKQIVKIYNARCPNVIIEETIEADPVVGNESARTNQTRCWGGAFLRINNTQDLNVYRFEMYSTAPTYPQIAVWGDSYVENYGRNPRCGYGYLMKELLDGDVFLSGRGGATAKQAYGRFLVESNLCAPRFIILNFGVNDSFGATATEYKEYLSNMIQVCKDKGAEPILITTPIVPAATDRVRTFCNEVNPWIRATGYRYIDLAYALSTGDGVTADASKFMADGIHPNLAGGQANLNYIKAFLPDLLLK